MKAIYTKTEAKTIVVNRKVINHRYGTRFKLRNCSTTAVPALSPQTVLEFDHAPENHELVSCKRRKISACFPKDMVFEILVFLPAKVLNDVIRYVCWEWYHLVKEPTFVRAHFQMSPIRTGMLVKKKVDDGLAFYVEANIYNSGLEETEFALPPDTLICSSMNGLVLLQGQIDPLEFQIVNLVTRVKKSLPRFGNLAMKKGNTFFKDVYPDLNLGNAVLACTSQGCYKVICLVRTCSKNIRVQVCTVGVDDDWRVMKHISSRCIAELRIPGYKHTVRGYSYWYGGFSLHCTAFDIDNELVYEIHPPKEPNSWFSYDGSYVRMAETLGFVQYTFSESDGNHELSVPIKWTFWVLKDIKSEKWIRLFEIDTCELVSKLGPEVEIYSRFSGSYPLYYNTANGKLWLLLRNKVIKRRYLGVYTIKTGDLQFYYDFHPCMVYDHLNTLLPVENC